MTGVAVANTVLSVLKALVQIGVPLAGYYIALQAPNGRTHAIWRGLRVFFVLTLVAAVGRQMISLIASPLLPYLLQKGLPTSQAAMIVAMLSLPFGLVSLTAWVVLAALVVRQLLRKREA